MKSISKMLKEFREQKGWSQHDLAAKVGASQATVSDWEKGRTKPRTGNALSLANVLGIPMDEIMHLIVGEKVETITLNEPAIKYHTNARSVQPNIKELYRELPFASLHAQAGIPESSEGCQLDWINETYPVYIGNYIASKKQLVIEVDGDSMKPNIVDGARILGERIAKGDIKYESGGVYAVLFGNGRFVVKRIKTNTINTDGMLRLWSDNTDYGHIDIPANEIHCMWKIVGKVWEPMK